MKDYLNELIETYGQENAEHIEDYLAGLDLPTTQLEQSALEDGLEEYLDSLENDWLRKPKMKFTTNYKGFKIVTTITKNSKYSMVIVNGFTRFAGNFMDTINYIDSVTAN